MRFPIMALGLLISPLFTAPAIAACKLAKMAELPVTMSDMRPLISAKINGDDVRFAADSGAFYSMISAASAAEHNLKLKPVPPRLKVIHGVGGGTEVSVATVKDFTLADIPLHHIDFLVGGSEAGADSVGLLGQNVFRIGDVEYDLANGVIRIMRPVDCANAVLAYWVKPGEAYSVMDIISTTALLPHTMGTALLNGEKIRVAFDTGAATSMLTLKAAARAGVKPDSPGVIDAGYSIGIGRGDLKTYLAQFSSFKIGDEEIRNAQLRFADYSLEIGEMLIGVDFFLSHRIYVASSQHKLYFTYNGGPVFNLSRSTSGSAPSALPRGDSQADASELSRRGMAFASRRDFQSALADLSRASELEPGNAEYLFQLGVVHWENDQADLARSEFDRVLMLQPDHLSALMDRAELRMRANDSAGMAVDLETADRTAAKEADIRLQMGYLYAAAELPDAALAQFDLWIRAHPVDSRFASALNSRCWTRALQGENLSMALSDCNEALKMSAKGSPLSAEAQNSRGLVHLRLGAYGKSIEDYDAVLKAAPKSAGAIYGRGIAKIRSGRTAEGEADIADAVKIAPTIADLFAKHGVVP